MRKTREVPVAGEETGVRSASKKPAGSRKAAASSSVRTARAAQTREQTKVRKQEEAPWVNPASLQAPPALPGMVQRWIRVGSMGKADPVNTARKIREGWRPRPADTVPDDFPVPRLETGKFTGAIGVEGMVLMQMPKERNAQRNAYFRKKGEAVTRAIDEDLMRANAGAGQGFGPIKRAQRSVPVREKSVAVAGDEDSGEE
jgi:hypothetical protein